MNGGEGDIWHAAASRLPHPHLGSGTERGNTPQARAPLPIKTQRHIAIAASSTLLAIFSVVEGLVVGPAPALETFVWGIVSGAALWFLLRWSTTLQDTVLAKAATAGIIVGVLVILRLAALFHSHAWLYGTVASGVFAVWLAAIETPEWIAQARGGR
jgi:hypothetical protein